MLASLNQMSLKSTPEGLASKGWQLSKEIGKYQVYLRRCETYHRDEYILLEKSQEIAPMSFCITSLSFRYDQVDTAKTFGDRLETIIGDRLGY
jgi:hypothetical protein